MFEGGFLGLDNIGPIDRSAMLPVAARLEQSDGTAWMAMYALNLLEIALVLAEHDRAYEDAATKFFEHFAYIAQAMREKGLWNDEDGFFYDLLALDDGQRVPLRVRSMVGLLPLTAVTTLGMATLRRLPDFAGRPGWFLTNKPAYRDVVGATHVRDGAEGRLLAVVDAERLVRIMSVMLDEQEFLSPYGLRASRYGAEDEAGALNEITPGKVLEAVRLVRRGGVRCSPDREHPRLTAPVTDPTARQINPLRRPTCRG